MAVPPLSASASTAPDPTLRDGLLVRRALVGDREAIDTVLARLACIPRFVFRLNLSQGHRLPADVLEDVVQQVYAAIWPRLTDYTGGASLESWAFGFCRNCLRAESRRRATRLRLLPPARAGDDDTAFETAFADRAPDEHAAEGEVLARLRVALAELPSDEREVVELRHLEDWSFERIARELGLAASTVKDRGYRGICRLRRALREADRTGEAG